MASQKQIERDLRLDAALRSWHGDILDTISRSEIDGTPRVFLSLDRIAQNLEQLRGADDAIEIHFPVKALYSRKAIYFISRSVQALDVQSEWEASWCPLESQLAFHSPWLDERVIARSNLFQVSLNSTAQALKLASLSQDLRVGFRVALPDIEAGQFIGGASKFGIAPSEIMEACAVLRNSSSPCRFLHHHSTSRLNNADLASKYSTLFSDVIARAGSRVIDELDAVNLGGGLDGAFELHRNGICLKDVVAGLIAPLRGSFAGRRIVLEPGRFLVEDAGVAIATVRELHAHSGNLFAVLDLGTGFLIPLAAARFRFVVLDGQKVDPIKVHLVDGTCSPNGIIAEQYTDISVRPGSRVAIFNIGSYTTSCSGPFHSPMPELWTIHNGELEPVALARSMEEACRAILY